MLSSKYRLRLEYICKRISDRQEVQLEDMIWADKLAKANRSAGEMLRRARRVANNPDMKEDLSMTSSIKWILATLIHSNTSLDSTASTRSWNGFMTTSQLTGANEINRSRRLDHRAAMHRMYVLLHT